MIMDRATDALPGNSFRAGSNAAPASAGRLVTGAGLFSAARKASASFAAHLGASLQLRRTRRALAELSDYELHDIGLTRAQARHEASRPWWND
jgi:uncharacterized protein YjiS (DUF1127 family)